ncbi:dehydrogenase/reductase SDR family member 1-like [Ptychodera flava]|uniref:dehydrogenase/reductase SDR family member 1-like n=1 Tax=Ptychodera flava TaxID=63121 RepID=UPI00396AA92D
MSGVLAGKVCIVTGASRGIGKGIALQLAEAGATVYITGRTLAPKDSRLRGSLQETAEEVKQRGGQCIPVQCDHSDDEQVKKLFDRVSSEQNGRLDVLVNNAYSAVTALSGDAMGKKFWELPPEFWDEVNIVGLRGHYIASVYAARMMIPARQGLIINISSPGGLMYLFNVAYGVGKAGVDKMANDCAQELRRHSVSFVSLWPGAVRTEIIQDTMLNAPEAKSGRVAAHANMFKLGETPEYSGKAVVHLASDPKIMKKTGRILMASDLAREYGFKDIDGRDPFSSRCVKDIMEVSGYPWLAMLMPRFIRIPHWLMAITYSKL